MVSLRTAIALDGTASSLLPERRWCCKQSLKGIDPVNRRVLSLFLVVATLGASCLRGSADPVQIRASIAGYSDPSSSIQFALRALDIELTSCMTDANQEDWVKYTRPRGDIALGAAIIIDGLPNFALNNGEVVGYSSEPEDPFARDYLDGYVDPLAGLEEDATPTPEQQATIDLEVLAVIALLGPAGSSPTVSFEVPGFGGFGQDMGGCMGQAYGAVVPAEDQPAFLAGEFIIDNLASKLRHKALKGLPELDVWQNCMKKEGFDVTNPFRVSSLNFSPQIVAPIDALCRDEADFDTAYQTAIDKVIRSSPAGIGPALNKFERITKEIQDTYS